MASFKKSWTKPFRLAGLQIGRKSGFVWHDLRPEYGSALVEHDATVVEAKEITRDVVEAVCTLSIRWTEHGESHHE